ncbi:MAG TPA: hypothetical protein VGF48_05805 [Thermoanaerobaculia bacterium]|jgi:hypothetical protein
MSNILTIFWGKVRGGKLYFDDRAAYDAFIAKHEGKPLVLTFRRPSDIRTNAENRYYWGVIVRMVAEEMGIIPDEAHEFLKSLFLKEGVELEGGRRFEIVRSTADLTVADFESYCEKCRQWSACELECVIPLPGEIILES